METNRIEHYGPGGKVLVFENPEGLYPVNRYQSLLLATNALTEALAYAGRCGRPLGELRALEVCCGGGPAAIVLKSAGVGHVEATDVNPLALEACQRNALLNRLVLDHVALVDLLGPPRREEERFDLIVCNPPCGRTEVWESSGQSDIRLAVDGGPEGIQFVLPLICNARNHLRPGGCLIFVLTSTMDFLEVQRTLGEHFSGSWRLAYHTPVAQPYAPLSSSVGQVLLSLGAARKAFVWEGEDGYLWRMTWVVVASNLPVGERDGTSRLWFLPTAYDVTAPGFWEMYRHFQAGCLGS
jgi:SAM-dependent methyltransferase